MLMTTMCESDWIEIWQLFCRFSFSRKEPNQMQRGCFRKNINILQGESPKCSWPTLRTCENYQEPAEFVRMRLTGYWKSACGSRFFVEHFQVTRWTGRCYSCGLFGWSWCSRTVDRSFTITLSKIPQRFLVWRAGRADKPCWDILWVRF